MTAGISCRSPSHSGSRRGGDRIESSVQWLKETFSALLSLFPLCVNLLHEQQQSLEDSCVWCTHAEAKHAVAPAVTLCLCQQSTLLILPLMHNNNNYSPTCQMKKSLSHLPTYPTLALQHTDAAVNPFMQQGCFLYSNCPFCLSRRNG